MKILITLFLVAINVSFLFSYGWERVYPEITCKVREIKYSSVYDPYSVIFAFQGDGIGYYEGSVLKTFRLDSLPVISVEFADSLGEEILCAMGNGSVNDGLYKFNKESETYNLLLSSNSPNFVSKLDDGKFYFGSKEGLFYSEDCVTWHSIDSLSGKNIFDASYSFFTELLKAVDGDKLYIFENDTLTTVDPDLQITDLQRDIVSLKGGSFSDGIYLATKEMDLICNVLNPDMFCELYGWNLVIACQSEDKIYYHDFSLPSTLDEIDECAFNYNTIFCLESYPVGIQPPWVHRLVIGTDTGVYTCDGFVGIEENGNEIKDFELFQNYPNPFNNETMIKLNLEKSSNIKLDIFNSCGEIVQNLVSSKLNKGNHSLIFKAEYLNSGLYYYKLTIDGVAKQTRKMLYLK